MTSNNCLPRSTTSSMYFDFAFAVLCANIDEEWNTRINDVNDIDTSTPALPDKPSWWFYKFRIYTQVIVFLFNVAKVISEASRNDTNGAILSVVRSICILGIIARHYYLCNYKFMDIVHEKMKSLIFLQILFMWSYMIIGAISAGIDPFFASDRVITILFFLLPMAFRILSFATASLWSKMMTRTATDGTVTVPEISSLLILSFYQSTFFLSLAGSNSTSKFFSDRLLCGIFFLLPFFSHVHTLLKREKKREILRISQKESSRKSSVSHRASVSQQASVNQVALLSNRGQIAVADSDDTDVVLPRQEDNKTTRGLIYDPENIEANNVEVGVNVNIDPSVIDHDVVMILDQRKQFAENKIYALGTPVACTFMIIMSFELAMSMYLYHRDGIPANWCEPFTFQNVEKGFQIVLDFFL